MSATWIKFRAELFTSPKFMSMVNWLKYDSRLGLLEYIMGQEYVDLDMYPPSGERTSEATLRYVTPRALRDVTACGLLRVWCVVNEHGKVVGDDAVCDPMTINDLDEITEIVGFGQVMSDVGWVRDYDGSGLLFPNFTEFNEPASVRQPAKSNAERQREHRARQKQQEQQ